MKKKTAGLANRGSIAKNSVLATVRATGKATVVCQDGALAVYKGAALAATRTSDILASSAKLLNPFKKRAMSAGPAPPRPEPPPKARLAPKSSPAEKDGPEALAASGRSVPAENGEATTGGMTALLAENAELKEKMAALESRAASLDKLREEAERLGAERDQVEKAVGQLEQEVSRLIEQNRALAKNLAESEAALAEIRKETVEPAAPKESPPAGRDTRRSVLETGGKWSIMSR